MKDHMELKERLFSGFFVILRGWIAPDFGEIFSAGIF
jgi:hypothetical protein